MHRHSLLFHITLFFLFLMGVTNTLFFIQYRMEHHQYYENLRKRFHESGRIMEMSHMDGIPAERSERRLYEIMHVEILHQPADLAGAEIGREQL